jgi:hypothetical protein
MADEQDRIRLPIMDDGPHAERHRPSQHEPGMEEPAAQPRPDTLPAFMSHHCSSPSVVETSSGLP